MALFSISVGAVFFLIALVWMLFVGLFSQNENSGFAFGFILGLFPMLIGLVLVVPSTLYRTISAVKNKSKQTRNEKGILALGILISGLYISAFIKLVIT